MMTRALPKLETLTLAAGAFFQWWLGELAESVPQKIRAFVQQKRGWILIDISGELVTIGSFTDRYHEISRGIAIDGDTVKFSSRSEAPSAKYQPHIGVRLAPEDVLRRTITLPLAAEHRLRPVLAHEIERQTPFLAEQVYFDWRVMNRDVASLRIEVEFCVVPRSVVKRAIALAKYCGFSPKIVGLASPNVAIPELNFLDNAPEKERNKFNYVTLLWGLLAAFLAGLLLYCWVDRQRIALERLDAQVAYAKRDAQSAEDMRKQLAELTSRRDFLNNKQQLPRLIEILDAVAKLLPDDSWVSTFELIGKDGVVTGHSPSASKLIALFEASPLFVNPRFRSPVTTESSGQERFDISFELRDGK